MPFFTNSSILSKIIPVEQGSSTGIIFLKMISKVLKAHGESVANHDDIFNIAVTATLSKKITCVHIT